MCPPIIGSENKRAGVIGTKPHSDQWHSRDPNSSPKCVSKKNVTEVRAGTYASQLGPCTTGLSRICGDLCPCLCDTKSEQQPTPKQSLQSAFWANQKFRQNFFSTPSLSYLPPVWTDFLTFLNAMGFSPCMANNAFSVCFIRLLWWSLWSFWCCGSHSTYPCGQWIANPFGSCNLKPSFMSGHHKRFPQTLWKKVKAWFICQLAQRVSTWKWLAPFCWYSPTCFYSEELFLNYVRTQYKWAQWRIFVKVAESGRQGQLSQLPSFSHIPSSPKLF